MSSVATALPLSPGDPVPELVTDPPFSLAHHSGRWLMILCCERPSRWESFVRTVLGQTASLSVCVIHRRADEQGHIETVHYHEDVQCRSSDMLGALHGSHGRPVVVTLVDPRGTAQDAFAWDDEAAPVDRVLRCVGALRRR